MSLEKKCQQDLFGGIKQIYFIALFCVSQNFPRIQGGEHPEQENKTSWPYT